MNRLTKFASVAAFVLGGMIATVEASSAMSIAPAAQPAPSAMVQDVAWGCGPGWHPNPWGRCVPYGGPVYGYGYGYGWHRPVYYGGYGHFHGWHRPWHRW
jgi:hypothetical protein